ncbi:MAG: TlpA family protein disulfide reductase [Phycisphaeraceae bacterium]|nr:TlpA family protein disulfide reductase [Phycisphaeraceae bacterium]
MKHRRGTGSLVAAALWSLHMVCPGSSAALATNGQPDAGPTEIRLEGRGERRTALDAMQGKPFDTALLGELTGWSGSPVTAESIKGKVVVILTWAASYRTSHEGVRVAQELHAAHAKDGLIVIGVHDQVGFDRAADVLSEHGAKFANAHDAGGRVKAALMVDVHPDFYLIDRAGRMRFADVVTSSVAPAAAMLLAETEEQAAKAPAGPAQAPAQSGQPTRDRTTASGVTFQLPDAAAYAAVKWPEPSKRVQHARDLQGKPLPVALGNEKFLGDAPDTAGKIIVIDFWATWCGPCVRAMPGLERLYQQNKADVVVIGLSDEPEGTVKPFLAKHKHEYPQAIDTKMTLYSAMGIRAIPHAIVISTDGHIRWQGNPLGESAALFRAVQQLARVDPGVQARRTAEAEALRK